MKGAYRRSPLCNVVPVPDPEKLSDAFYFKAHALSPQTRPTKSLVRHTMEVLDRLPRCRDTDSGHPRTIL